VLAEAGYERMTMDAVAASAGTGKATIYRRWPSKAQLVVDAIASTDRKAITAADVPDTGSLRGDLLALADAGLGEENSGKLRILAGLISAMPHHPDLAAIAGERLVAPRTALMRELLQRAAVRGELAPGRDLGMLALAGPAMTVYRVMITNQPMDRAFYAAMVDEILLPMATGKPRDA
jgi:AcrR family transcriptional regulator